MKSTGCRLRNDISFKQPPLEAGFVAQAITCGRYSAIIVGSCILASPEHEANETGHVGTPVVVRGVTLGHSVSFAGVLVRERAYMLSHYVAARRSEGESSDVDGRVCSLMHRCVTLPHHALDKSGQTRRVDLSLPSHPSS